MIKTAHKTDKGNLQMHLWLELMFCDVIKKTGMGNKYLLKVTAVKSLFKYELKEFHFNSYTGLQLN